MMLLIHKCITVIIVNCCGVSGIKHFRMCWWRKIINVGVAAGHFWLFSYNRMPHASCCILYILDTKYTVGMWTSKTWKCYVKWFVYKFTKLDVSYLVFRILAVFVSCEAPIIDLCSCSHCSSSSVMTRHEVLMCEDAVYASATIML